jgi:hypothetical protein
VNGTVAICALGLCPVIDIAWPAGTLPANCTSMYFAILSLVLCGLAPLGRCLHEGSMVSLLFTHTHHMIVVLPEAQRAGSCVLRFVRHMELQGAVQFQHLQRA